MITCWRRLNFEGGGGLTSKVAEAVSFFYLWWRLVFFGGGMECRDSIYGGGGLTSRLCRVYLVEAA